MTQEISYFQARAALWMSRLLNADILQADNMAFYYYLNFSGVSLKRLLRDIIRIVRMKPDTPEKAEALEELRSAQTWTMFRLTRDFNDIIIDNPALKGTVRDCALKHCQAIAEAETLDAETCRRTREKIAELFGLSPEAQELLEFAYIHEMENNVSSYLEGELEIFKAHNRRMFAVVMDMDISAVMDALHELQTCCLLGDHPIFNGFGRIADAVFKLYESPDANPEELFCSPLKGDTLPLERFNIAREDLSYITRLLKSDTNSPVHIMIYGSPGTGKTTFARSLAHELGLTAWTSNTSDDDARRGREGSVVASMNIAAKRPGSFIVVDEAEQILHSGIDENQNRGKEKSWLHALLEKPGCRVIWITNHVEHIHPSVMRRFSYSVYFHEAGRKERERFFADITERHSVRDCFSDADIKTLARNYAVPAAVIENAVTQAKTLGCDGGEFVPTVEQFIKSYLTLLHGGRKFIRRPSNEIRGFTLSGVSLDGSAIDDIMRRCRRADEAMKLADGQLEGGCATMLFYGPPGTGKTALARHIAYEIDRECIVQRGSDLLNCYVGNTEKNIAGIFRQAEDEGAVLVIDEADTFLFRRDMAVHSWEVSQVNEFLTCLEECRCFCICTTNRLSELDAASVRRFSYKVAFSYSGAEQITALYDSLLAPLCTEPLSTGLGLELSAMKRLTPGDFHAVRMQYASYLSDCEASHEEMIAALKREVSLKH